MAEPTKPSASPPKQADHPEWEQDDAKRLKDFFTSQTGERVLAWLRYWSPVLLDGKDVNMTLVASGEVKGFGFSIECLYSLMRENPVPENHLSQTPEYPDLEDDNQWGPETDTRK